MVFEIQIPITCLDTSRIFHLPCSNLVLLRGATLNIPNFDQDQQLGNDQRAQRESMAKHKRALRIDLSCNDTCGVTHRLLHADGGRTTIVWRDVDVEPGEVETRAVVDGDGAQECSKKLYRIGGHSEE